jgi:hypothetical protein
MVLAILYALVLLRLHRTLISPLLLQFHQHPFVLQVIRLILVYIYIRRLLFGDIRGISRDGIEKIFAGRGTGRE